LVRAGSDRDLLHERVARGGDCKREQAAEDDSSMRHDDSPSPPPFRELHVVGSVLLRVSPRGVAAVLGKSAANAGVVRLDGAWRCCLDYAPGEAADAAGFSPANQAPAARQARCDVACLAVTMDLDRLMTRLNPLVAWVLRSPLHPLVGGMLLLLRVTGRR